MKLGELFNESNESSKFNFMYSQCCIFAFNIYTQEYFIAAINGFAVLYTAGAVLSKS